jgi:Zn-dependent M28 family amino/carboxypeptidase
MGAPWLIDLHEVLEENKTNPHFDLPGYLYEFSTKAKEKGATALLWYNSSTAQDKLSFNAKDKLPAVTLPVFFIKYNAIASFINQEVASLELDARASLIDQIRNGSNVIGYIDNGAPTTVVLGAHFDHLGYGEDGNSRYEKKEAAIHNGADDNASGTATLLALGAELKKSSARSNNYLLIAFSGEELGLYGSKHFVENPTIDLKSVNYMINMDMVGRLNDSTKTVTIGGYGTSPYWSSVINSSGKGSFNVKIDSSGSGPSDHTSFYRKDIPVLFYFTGLHTDYHKPSDDADRINYKGMVTILRHIEQLIEQTDKSGRLAFLKTRETQTTTTARFSVSMGIMPDYTYSGTGVRADGVSEGRPAQKAGIRAGDIVLQIGDYKIGSMESYMQTLGKFKKGDRVKVIYQRGSEQLVADIQF